MNTDSLPADDLELDLGLDGWQLVTDNVMGGVSSARTGLATHAGRRCIHLQGEVSTENNGGFVQVAKDLPGDIALQAGKYHGLRIQVYGNGESYNLHLRTNGLVLPWQAYRATFKTEGQWSSIDLPFQEFKPYKTSAPFSQQDVRRIGIVALGRDFTAEIYIAAIRFYRKPLLH